MTNKVSDTIDREELLSGVRHAWARRPPIPRHCPSRVATEHFGRVVRAPLEALKFVDAYRELWEDVCDVHGKHAVLAAQKVLRAGRWPKEPAELALHELATSLGLSVFGLVNPEARPHKDPGDFPGRVWALSFDCDDPWTWRELGYSFNARDPGAGLPPGHVRAGLNLARTGSWLGSVARFVHSAYWEWRGLPTPRRRGRAATFAIPKAGRRTCCGPHLPRKPLFRPGVTLQQALDELLAGSPCDHKCPYLPSDDWVEVILDLRATKQKLHRDVRMLHGEACRLRSRDVSERPAREKPWRLSRHAKGRRGASHAEDAMRGADAEERKAKRISLDLMTEFELLHERRDPACGLLRAAMGLPHAAPGARQRKDCEPDDHPDEDLEEKARRVELDAKRWVKEESARVLAAPRTSALLAWRDAAADAESVNRRSSKGGIDELLDRLLQTRGSPWPYCGLAGARALSPDG